jgi:hypothetical protein
MYSTKEKKAAPQQERKKSGFPKRAKKEKED